MRHPISFSLEFLPVLLILCPTTAFSAPAEITITGERGFPVNFAGLSGENGAETSKIVRNDLTDAGFFRFVGQSRGAFAVGGAARGERLEGRLVGPSGKVLFQRAYGGTNVRRLAHQFSADVIAAITGQPSIANTRIAFVSNKTGRKELYLCDYDGGNVRPLTRDGSISVSPSFSPDGRKLAYTGYLSGYADIYVIDLPTGKRERIISQPGTNTGAAFSPDGSRLALTMSFPGNPEIFTSGLDGGRASRLTRSKAVESSPAWSPDGKKLVYVSDATGKPQLYTVNARGGRPKHLNFGYAYCVEPDWSPDGARMAFNVRENGRNAVAIHDFRNQASQTLTSGANAETPVWGADSRHLIYVQNNAIFLHDVETGARRKIVSGFGSVSELAWTR